MKLKKVEKLIYDENCDDSDHVMLLSMMRIFSFFLLTDFQSSIIELTREYED